MLSPSPLELEVQASASECPSFCVLMLSGIAHYPDVTLRVWLVLVTSAFPTNSAAAPPETPSLAQPTPSLQAQAWSSVTLLALSLTSWSSVQAVVLQKLLSLPSAGYPAAHPVRQSLLCSRPFCCCRGLTHKTLQGRYSRLHIN